MAEFDAKALKETVEFSTPASPEKRAGVDARSGQLHQPSRLDLGASSHIGLRRSNNEDHYAVVERRRERRILLTNVDVSGLVLPDDEAYVLIVADGMGGPGFGELASELVLRIGWELASAAPSWIMKFRQDMLPDIRNRIEAIGRQILNGLRDFAKADPALVGMGTTWTCAYVMGSDAILAHVGDSRAYLFRGGKLRQLTRDHTYAQALQDLGASEAEVAPYKHLLFNSFSTEAEAVKIDVDHVPLHAGDRLLLCSDGLPDMVHDDDITATLDSVAGAQSACDVLIEHALKNGGKDNVTAVLADFRAAQ